MSDLSTESLIRSCDSSEDRILIYTDGSCLKNPNGPGGWAYKIMDGDKVRFDSGGDPSTTNNKMELLAVILAVESLEEPSKVSIYTDSQYVCNAISEGWLQSWIRRGWRTSSGSPVKNRDMWERWIEARKGHDIKIFWVRGHAGHEHNEFCDRLAGEAARQLQNNLRRL